MHAFDPALMAEIAYRREDVRTSFRSSRRLGTRAVTSRRGTTPARTARPVPTAGTVAHRTA